MSLISWDDFKKQEKMLNFEKAKLPNCEETNIACPKCGAAIWKDVKTVFRSYPPRHKYMCFKCGWTEVG